MKRVLISGASGFAASHLLKALCVRDGISIRAFIRDSSSKNLKRFNDDPALQAAINSGRVEIVKGDLTGDINGICEGVDVVYHAAALTFVDRSIISPEPFIRNNVTGTFNLIEDARKYKVGRFVFYSTDEVLGEILNGAYKEDAPANPRNIYAASKLAGEGLCMAYAHTYGLHTVITRSENLYGCYSDDTEVLSRRGFVRFQDLRSQDEVATLNSQSGELEYQLPSDQHRYWFDGEMIRFSGSQIDLCVTPNHRMYVALGRERGLPFLITEAGSLPSYYRRHNIRFKLDAAWSGEKPTVMRPFKKMVQRRMSGCRGGFSSKVETDSWNMFDAGDWVEFMAWFLSEGSVSANKGTRSRNALTVQIRQTKPGFINQIADLCKRLGFHCGVQYGKEGRVRIYSVELGQYLKQFGKAGDKFIPDDIKQLSPELLRRFLITYGKGDGVFASSEWATKWKSRVGKLIGIVTKSARMVSDLQELALKIGIASSVTKEPVTFRVNFAWDQTRPALGKKDAVTHTPYSGYVYCVSVPNRIIFVRRNGKVAWCGNSWQHPQKVIPTFVRALINGDRMPVYGKGDQIRQWLHVTDQVSALIHLVENHDTNPGEIYHVAGAQELTNLELAKKILGAFNGMEPVDYEDNIRFIDDHNIRPGHDRRYALDTTKITATGWKPQVKLDDGIRDAVRWYKENAWWLQ